MMIPRMKNSHEFIIGILSSKVSSYSGQTVVKNSDPPIMTNTNLALSFPRNDNIMIQGSGFRWIQ